ncbi:MAG TPA: hypothetical protein VGQ26_07135 [Streptosporangiaceae bacterium]|nr:hypothetical protein [Streptosporangiaceae bacterium]
MGKRNQALPPRLLTWAVGHKTAAPTRPQNGPHRPAACRGPSCRRPLCAAYKEGREDGYQDGQEDGYEDGYRDGYRAGQDSGRRC